MIRVSGYIASGIEFLIDALDEYGLMVEEDYGEGFSNDVFSVRYDYDTGMIRFNHREMIVDNLRNSLGYANTQVDVNHMYRILTECMGSIQNNLVVKYYQPTLWEEEEEEDEPVRRTRDEDS